MIVRRRKKLKRHRIRRARSHETADMKVEAVRKQNLLMCTASYINEEIVEKYKKQSRCVQVILKHSRKINKIHLKLRFNQALLEKCYVFQMTF